MILEIVTRASVNYFSVGLIFKIDEGVHTYYNLMQYGLYNYVIITFSFPYV
jgi:hypothetical protein